MNAFRILHVDDEPDIREVVEIALGLDPDMETRSCESGQEALATAANWSPDLILLDVMMPAMDGPETLKRLRESPKTAVIPVVFMTARAQSRELESFQSLGLVGVIPKPFDPMTLAASVHTYFKKPQTRFDVMQIEFLQRVEKDLQKLAKLRFSLAGSSAATNTLSDMQAVAHGLAGAGGIFGFKEISDASARLEDAVKLKCEGSGNLDEVRSALDHLVVCANKNKLNCTQLDQVHNDRSIRV